MRPTTEQPLITLESQHDNRQYISIIIESNKGTYTFKRNTYDNTLLENILSKREYNSIINQASIIMGDSLLKKKQYDSFTIPLLTRILCLISCICLVLYVVFFYAAESSKSNNVVYFVFSTFFISAGIIITLYQSYASFVRRDRVYLTLNEIILIDLKKYFDDINRKYNGLLCFIFNLGEDRSIECRVYIKEKGDKEEKEEDITLKN